MIQHQQQNPYFATPVIPNGFYNQSPQPVQIPLGLRGKFIDNPGDVSISDVPTDGSTGIFPSRDGNYILTKAWASDGTVKTEKFLRELPSEAQTISLEELLERVERLESKASTRTSKAKESVA